MTKEAILSLVDPSPGWVLPLICYVSWPATASMDSFVTSYCDMEDNGELTLTPLKMQADWKKWGGIVWYQKKGAKTC